MLKRIFLLGLACAGLLIPAAQARFVPRWSARVSAGYSYWKMGDLNQRILNRRPFFDAAGDSSYVFKSLPSSHVGFNFGLQLDVLPKLSFLGTLEYLQTSCTNRTVTDSFRVEALTRPREINLGLDVFWRFGPGGKLLAGVGSGFSFARFRDDVQTYQRRAGQPDTLSSFLLEKYSSLAIYGELRAVYVLPISVAGGQHFFLEVLGRLNPIEAFTGSKDQNGTTVFDADATFFPPGSNTAQPVKLDFSGFYLGLGSSFRL